MVRKLALAVSLALANLSVPAHALGLGEIDSKSSLNQNFRGEINLLSVAGDEIDSVRVKLADPDAFERAGVERPFYLSLLRFQPILTASGRTVIEVTSEFPIREPFLNFLVEVNWPNGRLLREYTVLLDPPTTTTRRAPVVQPPARTAASPRPPVTTEVPAPRSVPTPPSAIADTYGPVQANDTAWGIARQLRPAGVTMEQMMMALLDANPEAFVDNDINRLRRGRILRVPSIDEINRLSRAEARAAYRQQQDDWLARRDARLQSAQAQASPGPADATTVDGGGTAESDQLRIATARPEGDGEAGAGDDDAVAPEASELTERLIAARENAETSRQEAEALRSRVDDLQSRLDKMQRLLSLKDEQLARLQDTLAEESAAPPVDDANAEPLAEVAVPPDEPVDVAEDRLVEAPTPAVETLPAPADETPVKDEIVIEGEDAEDVAQAIDDVVAELTEAPAPAGSSAPDDAPALPDYRITDIPPQVDADRVVANYIEQQAADSTSDGGVVEELLIEPGDAEIVIDDATGPREEPAPALSGTDVEPPPAAEPVEPVEPIEPAMTATDPQPSEPQARASGSEILPPHVAAFVERHIVPIAAGGIFTLGLLGWLATRGRRRQEDDKASPTTETAVAEAANASVDESADDALLNADSAADLPDSSFLDDFSPSDINALQDETGEVDPVSEADVYIAYGRYQQAEELLRQAMGRDPDRLALKHKMLEVHYATRDADSFVALAQNMVDAGQDAADSVAWSRAQGMGHDLAPDNPLFAGAADDGDRRLGRVATAAVGGAAATVDRDTLSLDDIEISELAAAYEEETSNLNELETPSEVTITLDIDEASDLQRQPVAVEEPESLSLDDLDSIDFELPSTDAETTSGSDGPGEDISDTLDLDSMMKQAEAAIDRDDAKSGFDTEFSAEDLQEQLDELSDLSMLDTSLQAPTSPGSAESEGRGVGLVSEDAGSPPAGLDEPISLDAAFESAQDDQPDDLLSLDESGMPSSDDEVATKLDLARAYIEMGDTDGARGILEEVASEGSDEQRGEAEKLLSELA